MYIKFDTHCIKFEIFGAFFDILALYEVKKASFCIKFDMLLNFILYFLRFCFCAKRRALRISRRARNISPDIILRSPPLRERGIRL